MNSGTPAFVRNLLGRRRGFPNTADTHSAASVAIAERILLLLDLHDVEGPPDPGGALEEAVKEFLATELVAEQPARTWEVSRRKYITDFAQYEHLGRLKALTDSNAVLRAEIGHDYLVAPDVTVGVRPEGEQDMVLHAAVSCKWTIRSDRVQNIRHEGVILTRHRRGRQPHIVTVTAEPLPSRLAAIARGTGEVDAVYHLCLSELRTAVTALGSEGQRSIVEELVSQRRLFPFGSLAAALQL